MDSEKPRFFSRFLVRMASVFLGLVLVVYPLSVGPVLYYAERHRLPQEPLMMSKIYMPLVVVADKVPPVGYLMEKYSGFWEDLAFAQLRKEQNKTPPAEP